MSGALTHALECAARGWAVFPCSGNKHPRTPNGHKAASTEPERIKAMHVQFGFVLVGIATGEASNLAILDVDKQHNGIEWWRANRHRLPATRTHRTRSGGLHLLFLHKPGLRCSTSRIAPGIDVKAEGGACIFWPASGLPILSTSPLAPWPTWLAPAPKPAPLSTYPSDRPRPSAHIEAALAGLVRKVATAAPGTRNATLFWGAARCAEMAAKGELNQHYATAVLIEAASRAGLDRIESAQAIASAFRKIQQ